MGTVGGHFQVPREGRVYSKSGLWLVNSKFTESSPSPSCVVLVVWLGSLSRWKVNLRLSPQSSVLWTRFSLRIFLYCSLFIFPSTLTSLPAPAAVKQPHSLMLPPPRFTVGMVSGRWWACLVSSWHVHHLNEDKQFSLCFIRPENLVSHRLSHLSAINSKCLSLRSFCPTTLL